MCDERQEKEQYIESQEIQLPAICKMTPADVEAAITTAEKHVTVLDRIRKTAIKLTNVNDWINEGNRPYLMLTGAQKICGAFGLKTKDVECEEADYEDDKGQYKSFTFSGIGVWNTTELSEVGTCNTRDKFFGVRDKRFLPLSEVNINNIKKKAHSNFLGRLIKGILGLSFTWEEVEKYSEGIITRKTVTGVDRTKGKGQYNIPDSPELTKEKNICRSMLVKIFGKDKEGIESIQDFLRKSTEFTAKDGKKIKGKDNFNNISEKQLKCLKPKIQKMYNEIA